MKTKTKTSILILFMAFAATTLRGDPAQKSVMPFTEIVHPGDSIWATYRTKGNGRSNLYSFEFTRELEAKKRLKVVVYKEGARIGECYCSKEEEVALEKMVLYYDNLKDLATAKDYEQHHVFKRIRGGKELAVFRTNDARLPERKNGLLTLRYILDYVEKVQRETAAKR